MNFKEYISKLLSDSEILEMANSRSKVKDQINDLSPIIIEHLIKILYFEDDRNLQKHIKDIDGWFKKIRRLKIKGSNKISQKDYYEWLWDDIDKDYLQNVIDLDLKDYHNLETKISVENLKHKMDNIFKNISKDLENKIINRSPCGLVKSSEMELTDKFK